MNRDARGRFAKKEKPLSWKEMVYSFLVLVAFLFVTIKVTYGYFFVEEIHQQQD